MKVSEIIKKILKKISYATAKKKKFNANINIFYLTSNLQMPFLQKKQIN